MRGRDVLRCHDLGSRKFLELDPRAAPHFASTASLVSSLADMEWKELFCRYCAPAAAFTAPRHRCRDAWAAPRECRERKTTPDMLSEADDVLLTRALVSRVFGLGGGALARFPLVLRKRWDHTYFCCLRCIFFIWRYLCQWLPVWLIDFRDIQ